MNYVLLMLIALLLPGGLRAQEKSLANPFPILGKFFVSVDDEATIYLNGAKIHHAGINESSSAQLGLNPRDRIVVKLANHGGPRRFAMIFVSTDRKWIVDFTNEKMKLIPDPELEDFSEREFQDYRKFAIQTNHKGSVKAFGFKNSAEWLWGEENRCSLGSLVLREMFKSLRQ